MNHFRLVIPLCLVIPALAEDRTPAPLPPEQAAKKMKLPDGFRATVFAAEPDVVQPISFCIDDRGRLFVAEATNYGEWKATGKDRIIILEDSDGDGKADKRTVFYEGFNYVTGIEVGFGGVYVMSPPNLYFVPDRDGDDKPDGPPEVLFDGFGYKESRHNLANGFTWGPDGWLYGGHGRTSPSDVGRPGTPANKRIHCDGGVYRIHPTRLVFENFADGTTNPWGVDFDDYGQCFVSNCVNPHLFHMIQGGHYEPWRNRPSSQYAYERLPTIADHLHYPGGTNLRAKLGAQETLDMGGGHAHCGTLIYLGGAFPADFRNNAFMCNVHGKRINRDILKRVGSGYVASHAKDFAISTDPWFMGVTLRSGPDGSVFVSDWSDTGECHTYKPQTQTGRIYKISYGKPDRVKVDLAKLSDAELVKLQLNANDWYVRHARRLLQERAAKEGWTSAKVHAALHAMFGDKGLSVPQRLRAMWALHVTGGFDARHEKRLLEDASEYVRAWAIQLLCEEYKPSSDALGLFDDMSNKDDSPVVRLYLAAALQRLQAYPEHVWAIATGLYRRGDDVKDANLPLMIWYGIEPLVGADPSDAIIRVPGSAIPVLRRFISRRVAEEAVVRKDKDTLSIWAGSLAGLTDEVCMDMLLGTREGLRGSKSLKMPKEWPGAYAWLSQRKTPAVREQAAIIALVFGDKQAAADLRRTVFDKGTPKEMRLRAMESLIEHHVEDLATFLLESLNDADLRATAIRGLAAVSHADTPKLLLARYADLSPDERRDAVATLAARKESAVALLDAMEKKIVPAGDVSAYVARQLYALGDKNISDRVKAVWGEIRDTPADKQTQLARYKNQLTPNALRNADVANGRLLYSKNCQSCHKLFGEGGTIGPDLTGSNRNDLNYLLSNLVDPSAEVGRDYKMSVVTTTNERVVTGIIVERTPARVVVQTATEKVTIAAEDVESIKDSNKSIMPDGQLDALTREQVRDLVGYLMSKSQESMSPQKGK
jgi:putative membrane-bound dehydrogenase-like protein